MTKITDWKSKGETIINEFLKSKKNSNCLLELEELLLSTDEDCVLSMFEMVLDLFSKVLPMLDTSSDGEKNVGYNEWLMGRYEDFVSHLLSYLSHDNTSIQISALNTLLSLLKLKNEFSQKEGEDKQNFHFPLFKRIISGLTSDVLNQQDLIKAFKEYTKYYDVKLYLLKAVDSILHESHEVSEIFLQNCFLLLMSVKFPKKFDSTEPVKTFLCPPDSFQLKEKPFRKFFSSVWKQLLAHELSSEFLEKVLLALNENVIPYLQNPYLMTDFLTNAYNKGGVSGLLALKGLYILMDQCNLEYPDFFVKLYGLLDKDIVNGKFSFMFFELTDLFLSSTHLPIHLLAAFVKKMSRLTLESSAATILKVLNLLSTLLFNHPTLGVLVNNKDGEDSKSDPFCMEAVNPAESNAMKSSLWEIKALQNHYHPDISFKASELITSYPKFCSDVSKISHTSMHDIYKKVRRKRKNQDGDEVIPLALPLAKQHCK